jgi:hypothetical protein
MPDHVPARGYRRAGDSRALVERFLDFVLAHVVNAGFEGGLDRLRPVRLGHGDQAHRLAVPAARNGAGDTAPHIGQSVWESRKRHNRTI